MLLLAPAARAEDVRIQISADPAALTEAGLVTFTFSISNHSDYELHEVTISQGGAVYPIADVQELIIPPGNSANHIVISAQVANSQIGLPITFTVSWRQGGEPYSQDVPVLVERAADPVISLTRTVEPVSAKTGEHVKVQYLLKNDTRFDMSGITLIDEQLSDHPIYESGAILAGNATTVEHNYIMGEESVVSAPVVTYTVNGKTKVFSAVEPVTVNMILPQLSMTVTPGTPSLSGVPFSFELVNTGNQDIQNIRITDERGVSVSDESFSLKVGAATVCSYVVLPVLTEPVRHVRFHVTGVDGRGESYELTSQKEYDVYPFVDETQIQASLKAEIVTPWSAETGVISVRLTLLNNSTVALSNARVTEISLGELYTAETLPAGETVVEKELSIGSPRNLNFSAKAQDPTGTTREIGAYLLAVAYEGGLGTPKPADATASPTEISTENPFSFITGAISRVLVILGVIMGVAFIALVVLSFMERARSSRAGFFDDDEEEALDLETNARPRVEVLDAPPPARAPQSTQRFRLEAQPGSWQAELRPPSEINRRRMQNAGVAPARREDRRREAAPVCQTGRHVAPEPEYEAAAYRPLQAPRDAAAYPPPRRRAPAQPAQKPSHAYLPEDDGPLIEIEYDDEAYPPTYEPEPEPYVQPRVSVREGGTRQGPKVIAARPVPKVQPKTRAEIRHVVREPAPHHERGEE